MILYGAYVFAASITALVLAKKTDNKSLSFLLIFWIFTQPIFNTVLLIKTPGIGFDLQPTRILFLSLTAYYIYKTLTTNKVIRNVAHLKNPSYEKYIYIYLILVILSLLFNYDNIRLKAVAAIPLDIFSFIIVYLVAKKYVTESMFEAIVNAMLIMATASAMIAFVQIGIDSSFLKTCADRIAFGNVVRASATFQAEYELGYFQILSTIIAMIKFRGSWWRFAIVPLFVISLLFTFHRLDIIILLICLFIYVLIFGKLRHRLASTGVFIFSVILILTTFFAFEDQLAKSAFVKGRVTEDTLTGRLEQYKVILQTLPDHLVVGMGDYSSKSYYALMEKHKMVYSMLGGTEKWYQVAYDVHNGYLAVGIYYGVLAMVMFIAFLLSVLRYFKNSMTEEMRYSAVPLFAVLIWILANMTNGVTSFRMYSIMLYAILFGSAISLQQRFTARAVLNPHNAKALKRP